MEDYFSQGKKRWETVLDILVFLSVFVVTIFLFTEILGLESEAIRIYMWINMAVLTIFTIDLYRLWRRSYGFKDFLTNNWLDILATIPIELIALAVTSDIGSVAQLGIIKWFRVQKLTRLGQISKVSRISKLAREFKSAAHLKKKSEEYKKDHFI